jgi:hypothetical protein
MASLTVYAGLLELSKCEIREQDLTPMTLVYQACGYLAAMGVANLVYSLVPLAERRLLPARVERFRRRAFWVVLAISFALPFAAPLLFLMRCR